MLHPKRKGLLSNEDSDSDSLNINMWSFSVAMACVLWAGWAFACSVAPGIMFLGIFKLLYVCRYGCSLKQLSADHDQLGVDCTLALVLRT